MFDLVQELFELEDVKVIGYKIQNDKIYIQVESTKSAINYKKCEKLQNLKAQVKENQYKKAS